MFSENSMKVLRSVNPDFEASSELQKSINIRDFYRYFLES